MIGVLAGDSSAEARRVTQSLLDAGLDADIAHDPAGLSGLVLADLAQVRKRPDLARRYRVIAFGGDDSAVAAKEALGFGAVDYLPLGVDQAELAAAAGKFAQLAKTDLSSANPAMQQLIDKAQRVAGTDIAVLISGASGVGKEVIARLIHQQSPRAQGPYVAINCAAIPESILEATLFGHNKGAFTGASEARVGKFELAQGGTLLLDEITEMPIGLQSKLLRVLQEKEVERLGSNRVSPVDVRVIAATNRDPKQAIEQGKLREDLYFRLSVFPLQIPSLAQRPEDILPLAGEFLQRYGRGQQQFSDDAERALMAYPWPGNVRELENCVQRAVVLSESPVIGVYDLQLEQVSALSTDEADLAQQVKSKEDEILLNRLAANNGVRKDTAAELGISERTLRHKLHKLRQRGVLV